MGFIFPPKETQKKNMAHIFSFHVILVYSSLHLPYYSTNILHIVVCNNIEVTANTCTCTDVFTVITTKDESGGIYNSHSTGS